MQPKPESRITSLEQRTATIEATLIELSSDQAEELKAIRQDISANFEETKQNDQRLFDHVQVGFQQAHDFVQERFSDIASRFDKVEGRLDRIEANMATKDDITSIQATQEQILQLLQQRPRE